MAVAVCAFSDEAYAWWNVYIAQPTSDELALLDLAVDDEEITVYAGDGCTDAAAAYAWHVHGNTSKTKTLQYKKYGIYTRFETDAQLARTLVATKLRQAGARGLLSEACIKTLLDSLDRALERQEEEEMVEQTVLGDETVYKTV